MPVPPSILLRRREGARPPADSLPETKAKHPSTYGVIVATQLHLSDRARQLEPALKAVVVDLNARVLEGLSPHQRGGFMGALRRVIENTEALVQESSP